MMKCSPEQRKVLQENYSWEGRKQAMKRMYESLQLADLYWEYERSRTVEIDGLIANIDEDDGPRNEVFTHFFDKVSKIGKPGLS